MSSRSLSAAVLLLLTLAVPGSAGVGAWTPLGPDGGPIRQVAVHPSEPETAFADTMAGLFRTVDRGESWSLVHPGWTSLLAFAGDTLYAQFFPDSPSQSTDGGLTWTPAPHLPRRLFTMAADPRQPSRIWAASDRELYRSDDGGATWQPLKLPRLQTVAGLAVDPAGNTVYLLLSKGFFRSDDLGRTWKRGNLPEKNRLLHLAVDAGNPTVLYAATETELFRSRDRGNRWQRIGAAALKGPIQDVLTVGKRVYVPILGAGIFHSSNLGGAWIRGAGSPRDPGVLAAAPGVLYAATRQLVGSGGAWRSLDLGATWERASEGLHALTVEEAAVDPSNADVLYAGARSAGLLRSTDRGATWETVDLGVQGDAKFWGIYRILIDPPTVYALGAENRNFRSDDGGETWQRLQGLPHFFAIARDPRQPGALWGAGFGLFHSDDRGESWTPVGGPEVAELYLYEIQVDPRDPRIVHVGGHSQPADGGDLPPVFARLVSTADGGATWERRDAGLDSDAVRDLALDPASPDTMYAATADGLFRSADGGRTWTLSGLDAWVEKVVAAPTTPTTLYADVDEAGIQRSTDGGQTWTTADRGLERVLLFSLTVDPRDPDRVYAGVLYQGLYEYERP